MFTLNQIFGRLVPSFKSQNRSAVMPVRAKKASPAKPTFEKLEGRQLMSGSVSGVVYNDVNVDHTHVSGDPALAGVRVYADLGNHGSFTAGDPTFITNAQGQYTLNGLVPGKYTIREVVPTHFRQTEPMNNAGQDIIITSSSTHLTGVNFGDTQKIRLSGYVYDDANNDGSWDNGEEPVAGVTVYAIFNGNKAQATTNSAGYWVIGDLAPSQTFTTRVIPPSGFIQTAPSNDGAHVVTLQAGQTDDSMTFGIRPKTVVINSASRSDNVYGGDGQSIHTSTKFGFFNDTTSYVDGATGDGGTASLASEISPTTMRAIGSLAIVNQNNTSEVFTEVNMTFTLSAATSYSYGYDIFGNNFAFSIQNRNTFNYVVNSQPSSDPSITNYHDSESGVLAAGQYEVSFFVMKAATNPLATNSYLMNFNI